MLDLIAETCRGGDALKIHALQRMLYNEYLGKDSSGKDLYTNGDNIFEQNSARPSDRPPPRSRSGLSPGPNPIRCTR